MTIYGYARVSTNGQDLAAQEAELMAAGCAKVFKEKVSGAKTDRAELAKVIRTLEPGDVLVVTRLDRLARSTRDLLNVLATVSEHEAGFRSLKDSWADTTTPHGRLMLTVLGGLAEFDLIRARTGEGRKRAKDRGVRFGRPSALTANQRQEALQRLANGNAQADVARTFNVSQATGSLCYRCCSRVQPWPDRAPRTAAPSPGITGATRSVGEAMGLIAAFLIPVVLFFWFAFCLTVIAWLKTISHLCFGNFTRSALWSSVGCGLLFWWFDKDIDFDTWLHGSAMIVGVGALGTFARFYIRNRQAAPVVTPFEPTPVTLNINIELSTNPHADRHAVHDDLVAALRGAIGTKQGPRRIPGPTIIDQ
jgi:DNA invertase Pin-like site-specific DNA recombinase